MKGQLSVYASLDYIRTGYHRDLLEGTELRHTVPVHFFLTSVTPSDMGSMQMSTLKATTSNVMPGLWGEAHVHNSGSGCHMSYACRTHVPKNKIYSNFSTGKCGT